MNTILSRARRFPVYVWFIGVFPILHLYSANYGLVLESEVAPTILGMLLATTLLFGAATRWIRNPHKRAFYLGILFMVFSLSGHGYISLFMPRSLLIWNVATVAMAIAFAFVCNKRFPPSVYPKLTTPLNLATGVLLALPIATLATSYASTRAATHAIANYTIPSANRLPVAKAQNSPSRPDIYYIIPDGYPSDDWLRTAMSFDNTAFSQALEERGFVVVDGAQSNYGKTLFSLASTLNMRYYANNPTAYTDLDFLRLEIANSEIAQFLLQQGYTYINLLSGYLIPSPIADINLDFAPGGTIEINAQQLGYSAGVIRKAQTESPSKVLRELDHFYKQSFISLYFRTSILRQISARLEKLKLNESTPYWPSAPERFHDTIEYVETIAAMPEATFTLIHLLSHGIGAGFDQDGNSLPEANAQPDHESYLAAVQFFNSRMLQLFDLILRESNGHAVIIFQADHGSTFKDKRSADGRFVHFDIYAAYFVPASFGFSAPRPFTAVNSFPLVLNSVFESDFELKENRLIELELGYKTPFQQRDVTEEFFHE